MAEINALCYYYFIASRREMRYHSFNFANSFFGLMLKRTNQLMAGFVEGSTNIQCLPDEEYENAEMLSLGFLCFIRVFVYILVTQTLTPICSL